MDNIKKMIFYGLYGFILIAVSIGLQLLNYKYLDTPLTPDVLCIIFEYMGLASTIISLFYFFKQIYLELRKK